MTTSVSSPVTLTPGLPAYAALVRRDLVRFVRQPSRIIAAVGTAAMIWIMLAAGFAGTGFQGGMSGAEHTGPLGYGAYLLPGMAGMVVLFSSIFAAIALIEDRNAGFLQSVLVSPAPTWSTLGARAMSCSLISTLQALPVLLAAPLVGLHMGIVGCLFGMLALGLLSTAVSAVSLACAWRVNSVQGFHGVMNLLLMPMWMLSGAFFPITGSAGWMSWLMRLNPMTWSMEALRASAGGEMPGRHMLAWIGAFAFAGVGLTVAHFMMRKR